MARSGSLFISPLDRQHLQVIVALRFRMRRLAGPLPYVDLQRAGVL